MEMKEEAGIVAPSTEPKLEEEPEGPLPAPKVILLGDSGTGKTHALRTLLDVAGLTPFIVFTEPGMETLGKDILDRCHWRYIPSKTASWQSLRTVAKFVNTLDFEGIAKIKDSGKSQYTGVLDFIDQCANFIDQNGESFGDVTTWDTDRVLVMDSLTGYSDMASQLVVGGKPLKSQGEYQIAQNMIKFVYEKIVKETRAGFVMTAHIAREHNELTGGTSRMVKTVGKALAPDVPVYFSDVIETVRTGDQFTWSTAGTDITVKARNLPIAAGQKPSFAPLYERWKQRGGVIVQTKEGVVPALARA